MTRKQYTAAMQRLYEREVMTFLDNLPDMMARHHTQLTQSDSNIEQVRKIWKRRVGYVWLKFLLNEQELKDTEGQ